MFEDSLVESSGRLTARHPWTTAISFLCQSIVVSALLLLSLLYTETLPTQHWIKVLQAPPPPPAAAPATLSAAAAPVRSGAAADTLIVPLEIPIHVSTLPDEGPPQRIVSGVVGDVPGGVPDGVNGSVLEIIKPIATPPGKPTVQKLRVSSGVAEGMLVHQVKPQYPAAAKLARVEGVVALQAVIGKDGSIQNLRVISGHPLLTAAALEAVKQWRYKPYFLNGEAVEVETQIVVNFLLTHD